MSTATPSRRALGTALPLLACAVAVTLAPTMAVAGQPAQPCDASLFSGGSGTADSPFLIASDADLQALSGAQVECRAGHFLQTADIAMVGIWTPIGVLVGQPFSGTYDGGGHEITSMVSSQVAQTLGMGFIAEANGATIRNLTISGRVSDDTATGSAVGLVVGHAANTDITNVHAIGSVAADRSRASVGGIAGYLSSGSHLTNSSSNVEVTGVNFAGGLVGVVVGSSITGSYAEGHVTATQAISGVAGGIAATSYVANATPAVIRDSYATGEVSGAATGSPGVSGVGGIAGTSQDGYLSIINSYATGHLTRTAGTGTGFGGVLGTDAISAAGETAPIPVTVTGAVWNTDTMGPLAALSGIGNARSSAQMRAIETFTALRWGIDPAAAPSGDNPWAICPTLNDGFPYLRWQHPAAACAASAATAVPTTVNPDVATPLATPVFSRATDAPQTGRTRLVTRVQLGAPGTYTFIMLKRAGDARLLQYAGSAIGSRTLAQASWAATFSTATANKRIVLRSYFAAADVPLKGAAVRVLVIHSGAGGVLTSTLIQAGGAGTP